MYTGVIDPNDDGETHLNVYSKARTILGKLLSNFYPASFLHPKYGFFASVEAFWYWAKTGKQHDHLRYLWGFEAKKAGNEYPKVEYDNFREEICEAIRLKIEQNPVILKQLVESKLPLAHYYCWPAKNPSDKPKVVPLPMYDWLVEFIEQLRQDYQNSIVYVDGESVNLDYFQLRKYAN